MDVRILVAFALLAIFLSIVLNKKQPPQHPELWCASDDKPQMLSFCEFKLRNATIMRFNAKPSREL